MSKDDDLMDKLIGLAEAGIKSIWENALHRRGVKPGSPEATAVLMEIMAAIFVTAEARQKLRSAMAELGLELTGGKNGEPLKATRITRH
jgi:hypothetical protein